MTFLDFRSNRVAHSDVQGNFIEIPGRLNNRGQTKSNDPPTTAKPQHLPKYKKPQLKSLGTPDQVIIYKQCKFQITKICIYSHIKIHSSLHIDTSTKSTFNIVSHSADQQHHRHPT